MHDLIAEYRKASVNVIPSYQKEIQPDDGYLIHFTSGTTGEPKAALSSHLSQVNNGFFLGRRTGLEKGHQKICVQVPMFHAFGTIISALAALPHGSTMVLPSAMYSPKANVEAIFKEGCTIIHGTPTMFVDACELMKTKLDCPSSLHTALTAGSSCSPQLFTKMKQMLGVKMVKSIYGMTETNGAIFQSMDGDDMEKTTETVGYVHDHLEVKIVNASGKTVEFGQPGELLIRGYSTMLEYWGESEKTLQTIGQDKWLKTGDQMIIDEGGYGRIVGRIKDIIIRGGENIFPKEIEDFLNTHPDIIESQVFGVKDDRLGEEICVAVRLLEGKNINLKDIKAFCEGHINQQKVPKILKIVDSYPKTLSGKIQKHKLTEMVEQGLL